jgi:two-component system sensor histidine kinase BaeS
VELVLSEAVLLQHVINDLRDFAAADAGTLRLHPEPAYINGLLAQAVEAPRWLWSTVAGSGANSVIDLAGYGR